MRSFFKKTYRLSLLAICLLAIFAIFTTPFNVIYSLDTINCGENAVKEINCNHIFGNFVTACNRDYTTASLTSNKMCVDLKLFNLIKLKSIYVNTEEIPLYVGGDIVGFSLNGDGVVIIGTGKVDSKNGSIDTVAVGDIKKGDVIKEIEGESVRSVVDIYKIINKDGNKDRQLSIKLKRNGDIIETQILNTYDVNSGTYKLGLWVKDDLSGIGTLTYIRQDNKRFGALGHAICDGNTKTIYPIESGTMYPCTVIGINKASKGRAGELKGLFMQGKNNALGTVDKNCKSGVYGNVPEQSAVLSSKQTLLAGGRMYAKPGKACIRSSIDGNTIKDYEIEIVKTNYQSSSNEKSMVIKVTDKELLKKTGGIVQGMSGSPIIQNGRVIGAVTHVFLNDSTKGFGIYLDWMINQ